MPVGQTLIPWTYPKKVQVIRLYRTRGIVGGFKCGLFGGKKLLVEMKFYQFSGATWCIPDLNNCVVGQHGRNSREKQNVALTNR